MRAPRVRHLFIAALTVGAVAMLPASAGAHPEACAEVSAFTGGPSAEWLADWTTENEGCISQAAQSGFDDSAAELAAGQTDGTDNLSLLYSKPKPVPHEVEADFNSDVAFENGYAYVGNYDGFQVWDVRDGQEPALASTVLCPGSQNDVTVNDGILVTSTDSRPNQRLVRQHVDHHAGRSVDVGGPEDLGRARPVQPAVRQVGPDRLRLAHAHRAARA